MAKDPAFLFYSNDFISGTYTMSDEQVGKYIRLLCLQHQKGSLTKKDMLHICKTYDKEIFDKFVKEGQNFYNVKLRTEAERRSKYCLSRKLNKESKGEKTEEPIKTDETYVPHMETVTETISKDMVNSEFEKLWNEYDKKVGSKEKLIIKWNKLSKDSKELIFQYIPKYKLAQPDKNFRKNPETFLNNKSWLDEIILSQEQQKELKKKNELSKEAVLYRKSYENYDNELKAFGVTE